MNILVAIDNNIIEELKIMIQSVKITNNCDLNIWVAYNDLNDDSINNLKDFVKEKNIGTITFINIKEEFENEILLDHTTPTTYLRLFAPFYINEEIDRILYLE